MEKLTLTFQKEKETKNTIRYQEEPEKGKPPAVGTLYIQKYLEPGNTLKVTIEQD